MTDKSYDDALRYEAKVILPTVPWQNMVLALAQFVSPRFQGEYPEEPFKAALLDAQTVNLGMATLAIALAQIALNDPAATREDKDILREILIGLLPVWKDFDAASDAPKSEIAITVTRMASKL